MTTVNARAEVARLLHVFGEKRDELHEQADDSMDLLERLEDLEVEWAGLIVAAVEGESC